MSNTEFIIENGVLQQYVGTDDTVVIPDTVIEIGERAFEDNNTLEKVTIPNNVKRIGAFAFRRCKVLKEVLFLGEFESINGYAFEECRSLGEITIPEGITKLESGTFQNCRSLSKIHFPKSLKEIAHSSMEFCPLEELVLPDSVEVLGPRNITIGYPHEPYIGAYQKIQFGKNLKEIGYFDHNYYEFFDIKHDTDLSSVFDVKYSGTDPEPYNISGYSLLPRIYTDFSVDSDNPAFSYDEGLLLSKDKKTLLCCMITNTDEIVIPEGIETIMGHAFSNVMCGKLIIPGTVNNMIGSFVDAHIGELVLSEGITELQEQAFLKSYIKSIVIPHSIKKMGRCVFLDVNRLTKLRLFMGMNYSSYQYAARNVDTPFWFNKDNSFNDLEIVELYDYDDNFIARLGQPCSGENRKVYEHAHYYLDKFLQIGTVLKTDLEPGRYSDYCKLYKELKKKDSKIRVLYGVLSMPEIGEKKWSKAFLKDVKKYKKDILKMAEANDDKLTPEIIRSLL